MSRYRRSLAGGATFFFTVNTYRRRNILTHPDVRLALRNGIEHVRERMPFTIDAWVLLPNHLHAIWTLTAGDADYALRWRLIKTHFSRGLAAGEHRSESRTAKGERGIWQRRYWEHTLRDDRDFGQHADYIHINPVKHGHVQRVMDWPYSSFHGFVRLGIYPSAWAGGDLDDHGAFGER